MSATKSKVDLSLDDIIKNNKKGQQSGKRNVRRGIGNAGVKRKGQGVLKRKSVGTQNRRTVLKRPAKSNNNGRANGTAINKAATTRLVNKLVKNALKRVTVGRTPKVGAVRNVVRGRRGGVRSRGQTRNVPLNRVSQRSKVINRRSLYKSRAPVAALPSNRRGRGNNRRGNRIGRVARREANPIQAQLNFLRRQQHQSQRPAIQAPVIRQRQVPVRRQVPAQQRRPQVIYVQQQRPQPVRRQPQQIVYIQQQPRRPYGGRGASRGGRRPQRRENNDPFFEPPNFLQRIPISNVQSYGGGGRGRGGRFVGRF